MIMRKWEIYKAVRRFSGEPTKLHKRYETRAEARRVAAEMKRQGIVCKVVKRTV